MSNIREFKDNNGNVLAKAAISDKYNVGASISNKFQHESVPFYVVGSAINNEKNIIILGLTDEKFTTYYNKAMTAALRFMNDVKYDSIKDFIEPESYMQQFAESLAGTNLTPVGEGELPSICGKNIDKAYDEFMSFYNAAFERDAAFGGRTTHNNVLVRSFMRRYDGISKAGNPMTVVAGMDYNGIEYFSPDSALNMVNPLLGLLGSVAKAKQAEKSSTVFGQGKPCDAIDWGAKNRFLLMTPKEYEDEAFSDFLEFVQTFHMEDNLRQQFYNRLSERVQMRLQETMKFQGMAQASMQSLMANQQRLAQTMAQNSAAMSNMIMDSWNQKMASDSRISQARTEAIMGTNTYTNTYGQKVDVSVVADHVYQNQYGNVFGVSGNELDQDVLNKYNWTKLDK